MLHIMGITECKKWSCSFIQVLIVFVLIVANSGLSLGETNEASSTSQAEAVATKGRISGDEESKDKLMESTDQKKSRDWTSPTPLDASLLPEAIDQKNSYSWSSLNASFLSAEAIGQEKPVESGDSLAEVAQKTNNPVSDLWMFFMQNDFTTYDGSASDHTRTQNSFKFMPVMPVLLTEEIRLINRPVFQLQSFESPDLTTGEWNRETGLGDTILLQMLSPAKGDPEKVWGVGWTHLFPTATDDTLGGEKWAVGPAATYFHMGKKWIVGGVLQHWWDYAGDDNRADVNLTDFQYVIRYKVSPVTQIGTGPNIQYNWDTDELSFPIGIGADTTTKVGNTIVRHGFDIEYYIQQDDEFGPEWNIRYFVIPVLKAPDWATKPLF